MALFGDLSAAQFLAGHWQRRPLVVRDALPEARALVDGDTLAGLACEESAEARIVVHDPERDDWSCEHGPFEAARFSSLPASGWTLLVQAVDQWLPEAAAILERFDFLPRWRIDDAMFSYATPGGGVGPHFDYYDVFLVQVAGRRRWQLGERCDAATPLRPHAELGLLSRFEPLAEHQLGPGDMLYLPAGVAHRGDATSAECITCSVGFRAPSYREIVEEALARLAAGLPEDRRYRDPPESFEPGDVGDGMADRHCLDLAAGALAHAWCALDPAAVEQALAGAFASLVTAPRYPELIDPAEAPPARALAARLAREGTLELTHHASSRFAYRTIGERAELFVDGEAHTTSAALAKAICAGRIAAAPDARGWRLIVALAEQGSLTVGRRSQEL